MKKHTMKVAALGLAIATTVSAIPATGRAVKNIQEKPLAGITLSLEQFCDSVMEDQAKEQAAAQEAEGQKTTATQVQGGGTGQAAGAAQAQKKETEEKIRLNLNMDKLGIANVKNYLNVRKKPSESAKIIGKMTRNNGCNILSTKKGWARIESGKVRGYVKASYLLTGKAAQDKALKIATQKAVVKTQTLNVRYLPSTDARIYDQLSEDEDYTVERENLSKDYMDKFIAKHCSRKDMKSIDKNSMYGDLSNWAMLSIDNEKMFVSKDFVSLKYSLNKAVTIKEEQNKSSSSSSGTPGIVAYAMQFLGNPYVWGGTSLTHGTDCSGFTQGIYRKFGVSLPRTSSAQAAATRSVSSSQVQVGDLFFYGSGRVSHVALYIGNGQIIHASNHRDGIKISSAYYRKPLKIGRVR